MCFGEQNFLHKLFGVGPDAMSGYLYQDGSRKLQLLMEETFGASLVLTNAHNEWLTVLVDTGILGLISYAGIFVSAIVSFLKKKRREAGADGSGSRFLHAGIYRKQYVQLSADNERHDHVYDFGNGGGNHKKQGGLKNPPVSVLPGTGGGF